MLALRAAQVMAGTMLLLVLSACGSGEPAVMPDVVGSQLDDAKKDIERAGFSDEVEVVGGGLFGVLDDANWVVCEQKPAAGGAVSEPRLVVDRECGAAEPREPSPAPADPSDAATPAATVVDTTIDGLLDHLNSADLGGIQPGERFRFTGELFESDAWATGATGD
ncbi:MAG: PASTA domain-containing protein, partial [Glaciihabitans sp.]